MKTLTGLFLLLIFISFTLDNSAWARGGSSGGSSIGGGGGGGFRGGGGRGHFGGGRHFGGGGHRHFRHHHHHRFNFGLGFGGFYGPGYYSSGFYGYPYGYRYGYGYRSPYYYPGTYAYPSIAPTARPVYIERKVYTPDSQQSRTNYWHYCRNPEGYYPYVKQCPEGWLKVAPQPTPQSP